MQRRVFTTVTCSICQHVWQKRADTLKEWLGRCQSCASKIKASRPEHLAILRDNGRRLTLKYGGVPNAGSNPRRGPKSNLWKGGVTTESLRLRSSSEYAQWREAVYSRDNYTCQMCSQYGGQLQADHIKQWSSYPELRFNVDNGRTLCLACHYWVTFKRRMPLGSGWGRARLHLEDNKFSNNSNWIVE